MGRSLIFKILGRTSKCKIFVSLGLCLFHVQIFAQSETAHQIFKNISDKFSAKSSPQDHPLGEFFLLIIAGAILVFVAWLAFQFYTHKKQNLSPESAWGLFNKLCQIHNLSFKERAVIRKVCRWNALDDPLPLFVEPNYFKHILADETKTRCHVAIQRLLDKLFTPGQELLEAHDDPMEEPSDDHPIENGQVDHVNHKTDSNVEHLADHNHKTIDFHSAHCEQSSSLSDQEKPSFPATRVLLNPIPGHMAFSSLVEPVHRFTSEIASASIHHNLSVGRELNERTFNGIGAIRQITSESQSPFFPKSNVPSPSQMLANESRRPGHTPAVSPTPPYLNTHKETSPVVPGQHQSDPRHNQSATLSEQGDVIPFENIAILESIVMGK